MKYTIEILLTVIAGALFGGAALSLLHRLQFSFPEPHQIPVFLIGSVLFSCVFRWYLTLREEGRAG